MGFISSHHSNSFLLMEDSERCRFPTFPSILHYPPNFGNSFHTQGLGLLEGANGTHSSILEAVIQALIDVMESFPSIKIDLKKMPKELL